MAQSISFPGREALMEQVGLLERQRAARAADLAQAEEVMNRAVAALMVAELDEIARAKINSFTVAAQLETLRDALAHSSEWQIAFEIEPGLKDRVITIRSAISSRIHVLQTAQEVRELILAVGSGPSDDFKHYLATLEAVCHGLDTIYNEEFRQAVEKVLGIRRGEFSERLATVLIGRCDHLATLAPTDQTAFLELRGYLSDRVEYAEQGVELVVPSGYDRWVVKHLSQISANDFLGPVFQRLAELDSDPSQRSYVRSLAISILATEGSDDTTRQDRALTLLAYIDAFCQEGDAKDAAEVLGDALCNQLLTCIVKDVDLYAVTTRATPSE
jgi:hypothetical protein